MKHPINCADRCGTELGTVELSEDEEYKGDEFYGMLCDDCVIKRKQKGEM